MSWEVRSLINDNVIRGYPDASMAGLSSISYNSYAYVWDELDHDQYIQ